MPGACTTINRSHRLGEQAFFAADGGLAVARRALATAIQEELDKIQTGAAGNAGFWKFDSPASTYQVIPDPVQAPDHPFFVNVRTRALELTESTARSTRLNNLNGSSFTVTTIALNGGTVNPVALRFFSGSSESAGLRYTIVDIPASGYEQKPSVPLPANNFSQEYAVINGTGITDTNADGTPIDAPPVTVPTVLDGSGRVTKEALQANLRGVAASASAGTNSNAAPQYVLSNLTGLTTNPALGTALAKRGIHIG